MSSSLNAALHFGYDLGSEQDGWACAAYSAEEMQYIWPDWMEADEDGYVEDPPTEIENRLTELLGLDHGITTGMYGTDGWSGFVLGFKILSGSRSITAVDPALLNCRFPVLVERLHAATEALGLTFQDQPEPQLLLISSYL